MNNLYGFFTNTNNREIDKPYNGSDDTELIFDEDLADPLSGQTLLTTPTSTNNVSPLTNVATINNSLMKENLLISPVIDTNLNISLTGGVLLKTPDSSTFSITQNIINPSDSSGKPTVSIIIELDEIDQATGYEVHWTNS